MQDPCAPLAASKVIQCTENTVESSKKLNTELPSDPAILLLSIYPKDEKKGLEEMPAPPCSQQLRHRSTHVSVDGWTDKMQSIHMMERYSAINRKDALTPASMG